MTVLTPNVIGPGAPEPPDPDTENLKPAIRGAVVTRGRAELPPAAAAEN